MDPALFSHALRLIREACRADCLREDCRRLAAAMEAGSSALRGTGELGLRVYLAMLSGLARAMADHAARSGCQREAILLHEASRILESLSS